MQYLIKAYDRDNAQEKRLAVRPKHLANIAKVIEHVICAGGLLDENGKMVGSVLIMEFADRSQLDAYLHSEPYLTENVWEKVDIDPMNVVILDGEMVKSNNVEA